MSSEAPLDKGSTTALREGTSFSARFALCLLLLGGIITPFWIIAGLFGLFKMARWLADEN